MLGQGSGSEAGSNPWVRRLDALALGGALAALALITGLAWLYCCYAHPMADDFAVAMHGKELGGAGYANLVYATKSGRWTGHALLAFLLANVELTRAYPWLLLSFALVSLAATYAFVRVLLAETVSRPRALAATLAFQALLWAGRPAPDQTQYWVCGAVPYQLSVACSVLLVAGLIARSKRTGRVGPAWALLPLLALFVTGLQELVAMMLAVALAAGAWVVIRQRLPGRALWGWSLAATVIGCVASLVAPGNAVRAAEHPQAGDVLLTLRFLVSDSLDAACAWVLEPKLLAATAFLWLSPGFRALAPRWTRCGVSWSRIVLAAALLALAIGLSGPRYATGDWQPPRMLAVDYGVFLHAWLVLLLLAAGRAGPAATAGWRRAAGRAAAATVLGLALVLQGNGRHALGDLVTGRTQRWERYMETRYRTIRRAAEQGPADLRVPRPPYPPRVFVQMDIDEDASRWENRWPARYFGLRSLALESPAPSGAR